MILYRIMYTVMLVSFLYVGLAGANLRTAIIGVLCALLNAVIFFK